MRITTLAIDSYKSIVRPLSLTFSPKVNIFIGQNNSGKTNILDAVDFIFNPEKFPSRLHHHRARIAVTLDDRPQQIRATGYDVSGLTPDLKGAVKRLSADDTWDFSLISSDYQRLYQKYPQQYQLLNKLFSSYFPEMSGSDQIVDIDWQAGHVEESGRPVVWERLGSGFQRIFTILLYALHPDYPIILLDEPETHLHPALIRKLVKVLSTQVENQILLSTHSPLFIRPESLQSIYRVVRSPETGTEVHYLDQHHRGLDPSRLVQELNADNLEMFFADKVLMVEGASDKILMRGLIDRFYRGPLEIKVVEANGKGNMELYSGLLQAFRIPYIIMLDLDAVAMWLPDSPHPREWSRNPRLLEQKLAELRQRNIYILPNGSIENNYPRKYQPGDRKTLNAMRAAALLTLAEYQSGAMVNLRRIIEDL